ncbi:MAG: hypothetical protein Q7R30_15970 [Acidobacteriota bacterium]|nr:hypothetical protein [Acidobacteriota bacterium]
MLRARAAEVAAVVALATLVTIVIAAPVLRAPSERVFGMEIVGRHYDPFVVMAQMAAPLRSSIYSQPVTDIPGALLARLSGPVAAYNWLVLLSFPLSAAAAYLLARYLALSPIAAGLAAMAFAFSPFHFAHAAYHPHVAQTQWIPLYLLALFHCLDRTTPAAIAMLVAATIAVTLSNFYGGLIAAVITPIAVAAYWLGSSTSGARSLRRLVITVSSLAVLAAGGVAYASYAAAAVVDNRTAFAFARTDLFRYSSRWWSYLVPPVEHPLLGSTALRIWEAAGVREGLLEQQVSVGVALLVLGAIGALGWFSRDRPRPSATRVPILVIVAVAALVCSLSPEGTIGGVTFVRPSAWLYDVLPMFRSYARFGVVVQLMIALLAGIGFDRLRRAGTRRAQFAAVALVVLAAAEYAVRPSAMSRDVLPTTAHRWVAQQGVDWRVLDCTPLTSESESVQWLTGGRVTALGGAIDDCGDGHLPEKLAANGYTHLLERTASGNVEPVREGLQIAARFDDGRLFTVVAKTPAIYTATVTGFHRREHDAEWAWRWMGGDGTWTIVNTGSVPIVATLHVELSAFHWARGLEMRLDGAPVRALRVDTPRRWYEIGPLDIPAGRHELVFRPTEASTVARDVIDNGDPRRLSFAIGAWRWSVSGAPP